MRIMDIIPVARAKEPADVLLTNCRIVNVFSGEIERSNVAIYRKRIAGIGDYTQGKQVIDLEGRYIVPGLIDAHLHIESTMLDPREFARAVLARGTTTVIADPHEIVNVVGLKGIDFFIRYTEGVPLNIYFMIPSCVPATSFEDNGGNINVYDMIGFIEKHPRVLGLGEVMNYPGILSCDQELLTMIELIRHKYKKIDGHAPGLDGKDLNAYVSAFIRSDHESTEASEAKEKLARGMQVLMRYGSIAKDLVNLLPIVNHHTEPFLSLCTDDKHPDAIQKGHIDEAVRLCIENGVDPISAIRMATINTARHYDLRSMGAIAPGYKADLVVVDDLERFFPQLVMKDAQIVAKDGVCIARFPSPDISTDSVRHTILCPEMQETDFLLHWNGLTEAKVHSIQVFGSSVLTRNQPVVLPVRNGEPDLSAKDCLKIAVVNRYSQKKQFSLGFVSGTAMKSGAVATSVGHDAHNLSVTGKNDRDMAVAINEVIRMGGGMVVVRNGRILASLALPIAGLMSDLPLEEVVEKERHLHQAVCDLGSDLPNLMMTLSFVQLAVIPEIRITNQGLVDTNRFQFISVKEE